MGVYEWNSVIKQSSINIIPLTIISARTKISINVDKSISRRFS